MTKLLYIPEGKLVKFSRITLKTNKMLSYTYTWEGSAWHLTIPSYKLDQVILDICNTGCESQLLRERNGFFAMNLIPEEFEIIYD